MYAVIDVETTGLAPRQNKVVEVAIVLSDSDGEVERTWSTLLNPERDLGPQHIHGISASDVLFAPTFADVAGHVSAMMTSRVVVAHNIRFDLGFLAAEYARLGQAATFTVDHGVCTMEQAATYLPRSGRSLADCCEAAGVPAGSWHSARDDALATAQLLTHYLSRHNRRDGACPLGGAPTTWPALPIADHEPVERGVADRSKTHFLARISEHLPRHPEVENGDVYLQMLDRALLDRQISVTESDALVELAADLRLSRPAMEVLHRSYLLDLTRAALADGVVTDDEHADLVAVARLVRLPADEVDRALEYAASSRSTDISLSPAQRFCLRQGHMVVFTGKMHHERDEWKLRSERAGLRTGSSVSAETALLVAGDVDTMSGKAKRARELGVPIIDEATFDEMIAQLDVRVS